MTIQPRARIIAIHSYLPDRILNNSDLEQLVETTDEWIVSRTGIKERRIAADNEFASDMGTKAALRALAAANMGADKIDLIITATMTPDYITPSTAALIQAQLGAVNAAAVDMQAACSGFLYGLSMAQAYVQAGIYRNVLFIATEKMSAFIDYHDRNTCVIFGDGACACIISNEGSGLIIDTVNLGSDGTLANLVIIPGGGARFPASTETLADKKHYFQMNGKEVFKHAVRRMGQAAESTLKHANTSLADISWIIPHQANIRILDALARNFNIASEKVYKTIQKYGNTSGSSVGIALTELMHKNKPHDGEKLLLLAFGGGLTWGAALLTMHEEAAH